MTDGPVLSDRQYEGLRKATGRVNVSVGAIRSGKTVAAVLRFLLFVAATKDQSGELVVVGRTRDAAWRNVVSVMQDPTVVGTVAGAVVGNHGAPTVSVLGRTVYVLGASDAKAETSLRGLTVLGGLVDEVTVLPEAFFVQLLGRMSPPGARLFVTTNPDSPQHWFKVKYLDRMDDDSMQGSGVKRWTLHTTTIDDNPSLTAEYVASVKSEFTGLWYRRFILGEWVAGEGSIYSMFDQARHVVPWEALTGPLAISRVVGVGVDHGTTNPTAAIALGLTVDGRLVALDEWRHDPAKTNVRLTDAQLSARLGEWLEQPHVPNATASRPALAVDPAAASFRVQLLADGRPTVPAVNDVTYGIATVASLFGSGDLLVTDRCPGLLDELPSYAWDAKAAAKGEDAPVKIADHSADALRYVCTSTEPLWRAWVDARRRSRERSSVAA